MKTNYLILLTAVLILPLQAQDLTLNKCRDLARQNHPLLKQAGAIDELTTLHQKSIESSNLPQIDLTARATYQSEVTSISLPIPGFNAAGLSKDQYKLYVDVKQKIYDFGITKSRKTVEEADRNVSIQQNETELYKINDLVTGLYFQTLILQENERICTSKNRLLDERIVSLNSAVKNGVALQNDLDNLKAERLLTEQQLIEVRSGKKTTTDLLALILGVPIPPETVFSLPLTTSSNESGKSMRPEYKLFEEQKLKLDASSKLLSNSKLPTVYAFGQAGYGRPGLNMLNDHFKDWYLIGIGLSWNIYDGNKIKNERSALSKQKQIIDIQKENFDRSINSALFKENNLVEKYTKLIETDREVLRLKESIAKRSSSLLDNGTITSSDYLRDVNGVISAKINLSIHQISMCQSKENINIIQNRLTTR